jgi:hypothetical protein
LGPTKTEHQAKPTPAAVAKAPTPAAVAKTPMPTPAAVAKTPMPTQAAVAKAPTPSAAPIEAKTVEAKAPAVEAKAPEKIAEAKAEVQKKDAPAQPAAAKDKAGESKGDKPPVVEKPAAEKPADKGAERPSEKPAVEPKPVPLAARGESAPPAAAAEGAAPAKEPARGKSGPQKKNGVTRSNGAASKLATAAATGGTVEPTAVVVMPRPPERPWLMWALGGCVVVILAMGAALGYTVLHKGPDKEVAEASAAVVKSPTPPAVDDRPVGIVERAPVVQQPAAPAQPQAQPQQPAVPAHVVHPHAGPGRHVGPTAPTALSSEQKQLSALYHSAEPEKADVSRIPAPTVTETRHEPVSDAQIMGVVTRNKKSVQVCYERVLKHDNSLRNLRVDVELKIGLSGAVTAVNFPSNDFEGGELGKCLVQTIKHWHFPSQDSEYQTAFPLLLQAQ